MTHDDGEIFGFGDSEEAAIKEAIVQLHFTQMSKEDLVSTYGEGSKEREEMLKRRYDSEHLLSDAHNSQLT